MAAPAKSRLHVRRRKQRLILLSALGVLVLMLLIGIIALLRAPFMRIRVVTVQGIETIATSSLEELAQRDISGNYAFVIPKDLIFLYPKKQIAAAVMAAYPQVHTDTIHATLSGDLTLTISERQPQALWCGPRASSTTCYLMDKTGVVYAPAPQFSGQPYLSYFGALAGNGSQLPMQFLTPTNYESVAALAEVIAGSAVKNGSGDLQSVAIDTEGVARLHFASGFEILFLISDNAGDVVNRFSLALGSSAFTGHQLSEFDYLDLRFGDKLYYKLK